MNVHISYKLQRTPEIDKEIQHWTAKVEKRLQVFRPELVHLKGLLDENSGRERTTVSLNLRLPSGQMAVQESSPNATVALKAAFDELLGQISRHKEVLRNSHKWRRRGSQEGRPIPEVPFEETIASVHPATASTEEIRSYVNANFRRLHLFVERELYLRQSSGQIETDSVDVEEIVDEAVARALDDRVEKPDRIALDVWFYRLALQAMDDVTSRLESGGANVDIQGLRQRRKERASDEARMQFHQPDEAMTTESGIADMGAATPEEIAYTDEMFSLIQFALQEAAPADRESFILFALEGFSVEEIAAITDRRSDEVQQSIARAREKLRHALPMDNRLKRSMLQETGSIKV
jgi:RNA polymerase sigma factor (sigma-70 family)